MTTETAIDPIKASAARDAVRRIFLEKYATTSRQTAMTDFILATTQVAACLQKVITLGNAIGWQQELLDTADHMAGTIEAEFRKQFGRELFEQSRNP
jgi:hypothetical protein